jgi:hypothetical protein
MVRMLCCIDDIDHSHTVSLHLAVPVMSSQMGSMIKKKRPSIDNIAQESWSANSVMM